MQLNSHYFRKSTQAKRNKAQTTCLFNSLDRVISLDMTMTFTNTMTVMKNENIFRLQPRTAKMMSYVQILPRQRNDMMT